MTITFIGHGYVGLVTACVFADFGNTVWVLGHTKEKIERLKKGDPIIYEPGLKELLEKNLQAKRIHFTLNYRESVAQSDIVFIAVGTPPKKNGEADLSSIFEVAKNIAKYLTKPFTVVSCKSTVPVGTNREIQAIIHKEKTKKSVEVAVASCPEFLREGTALHDTLHPDRVVIGSSSKKAIELLLELHQPINGKRVITDLASSELIKYTSNAMLATKISFANLVSFYCEKTGADVETVLAAVGLDNRIGRVFLYPGVGYGGSCLPKDVRALTQIGRSLDINTVFLEAVEEINTQAKRGMIEKILKHVKRGKLAVWGLSFKPDTDDIREASSLYIIDILLKQGFSIAAYDPAATENVKKILGGNITYASNPYQAVEQASGLCVLTEWNEFKQADLSKVKKLMKKPLIFDGRNMYDPKKVLNLGFLYFGVGRSL